MPDQPQQPIAALAEGAGGKVFVAVGSPFDNVPRSVIRLLPDGSPDDSFTFPSGLSLGARAVAPTPNFIFEETIHQLFCFVCFLIF